MIPSEKIIILTLIILVALAVLSARIDAGIWKRKGISKTAHLKRAVGRGLFMGVQSWVYAYCICYDFWIYLGLQASIWWLIFDACINTFRGKELFYVGRTAFLDRIWWSISDDAKEVSIIQLSVKILLVVLFIIFV